jgi:hypothetical protein
MCACASGLRLQLRVGGCVGAWVGVGVCEHACACVFVQAGDRSSMLIRIPAQPIRAVAPNVPQPSYPAAPRAKAHLMPRQLRLDSNKGSLTDGPHVSWAGEART